MNYWEDKAENLLVFKRLGARKVLSRDQCGWLFSRKVQNERRYYFQQYIILHFLSAKPASNNFVSLMKRMILLKNIWLVKKRVKQLINKNKISQDFYFYVYLRPTTRLNTAWNGTFFLLNYFGGVQQARA